MGTNTEAITTHVGIHSDKVDTLAALFTERVKKTPDKTGFRQYSHDRNSWQDYTWKTIGQKVSSWRQAFRRQGMQPGDRVAILLPNSVAWVCCDQAALAEGLVVIPLYLRDNPENQAYIISDSGSKLLFVNNATLWDDLKNSSISLAQLEQVICLEQVDSSKHPPLQTLEQWLPEDPPETSEYHPGPDDLATIIYTSGTTGRPKGVMLTHRNILWNSQAILTIHPILPTDLFLSFLPLSHAFERTVGYYVPMMGGACIAYCRSIQTLAEDLKTIRPTVLISVPRIYERISSRIQQKLDQKGKLSKILFNTAVQVGYRLFEAKRDNLRPSLLDKIIGPFLQSLVGTKILGELGGNLRLAVTGGAPLFNEITKEFIGLGLPLVQGYGLSEASPVISANQQEDNIPESVGRPLSDVQVALAENTELLVKSPGVMLGYWQLPELTKDAFTSDGWLKTGDLAEIKDGYIYIRGRSKEILVTSTGENVAPASMEMTLEQHPLIDQALIIGEGKPFVAALLVLNPSYWKKQAQQLGLDYEAPDILHTSTAKKHLLHICKELLHSVPAPSMVHAVYLTREQWSIENGMLTPTLKLIRNRVVKKYEQEISAIYSDH